MAARRSCASYLQPGPGSGGKADIAILWGHSRRPAPAAKAPVKPIRPRRRCLPLGPPWGGRANRYNVAVATLPTGTSAPLVTITVSTGSIRETRTQSLLMKLAPLHRVQHKIYGEGQEQPEPLCIKRRSGIDHLHPKAHAYSRFSQHARSRSGSAGRSPISAPLQLRAGWSRSIARFAPGWMTNCSHPPVPEGYGVTRGPCKPPARRTHPTPKDRQRVLSRRHPPPAPIGAQSHRPAQRPQTIPRPCRPFHPVSHARPAFRRARR